MEELCQELNKDAEKDAEKIKEMEISMTCSVTCYFHQLGLENMRNKRRYSKDMSMSSN